MDAFGGNDEESAELRKLNAEVTEDNDNFEIWEKLVRTAETLEGGINRNSSPQAITSVRNVYDRFLAKFPLFFGYWKKYADLEFSIAGTEAAEMVYERGVASITNSVDLWTNYCSFKVETSHDSDIIRDTNFIHWRDGWYLANMLHHATGALFIHKILAGELTLAQDELCSGLMDHRCTFDAHLHKLFERGANSVGLDFLAHPFWDKYLEFEERLESYDRIFAILGRVIHIPMHQYARYFEKYRQMAQSKPLPAIIPATTLTQFQQELETEGAGYNAGRSQIEVERDLRARVDGFHLQVFNRTQAETTKRWTYESEIKRPYFHVTDLDEGQLTNWRKYLDYEEAEGDYTRATFLYERCLVTCAQYEEFWLRYARWMLGQLGKEEEVRIIYQRASCFYVPIALPTARLQYAFFEEMSGRVEVAKDIHEAILVNLPSHVETIVSLANLCRRQGGLEDAIEIYKAQIGSQAVDISAKASLVAEWATLLWKIKGSSAEARQVFKLNENYYLESGPFWTSYLRFEIDQPTSAETEKEHYTLIKTVIDDILTKSKLPEQTVKELMTTYMKYLLDRGTKDAAKEYMELDREINGPASSQKAPKWRVVLGDKMQGVLNGQARPIPAQHS